ncbi:MAG TPA: VWA domain-containing protein [Terriglobales bacterium]|jgi:VWFA-related protein|nr:VWA domain-containing protein [Terriglobales bacterium]
MSSLNVALATAPTGVKPRRRIAVPFLLCALALTPRAQEPSQTATFQTTSNLVVLDVVVTDRSGKVVTNLTRDDFTVLEDGVAQSIASFELPPKAGERAHGAVAGKSSQPAPGSSVNEVSPQALNILVLDELNGEVLDQAYGRGAIEKYLAKHGPRLEQPTSLMLLGQKRIELLHDFTQDARALTDALHHRHAELPFGLMASEFESSNERLSKTLWALQQIAYANSHFAGRKNVIWIGPGFPAINGQSLDPADRPRFISAVSESANSLLQARVAVYTLNPRGLEISPTNYGSMAGSSFLTGTQDDSLGDLVFESIAPETGGRILRLRNDVDVAIAESVEDGSAYYSLAYYPTNHNWNRKYRKIRIVVRGDHLQARTRNGYYGIADGPLNDKQVDTVLSRAVMNPLPYRALSIEAKAKSAGAGKGRFLIKVDRHDLSWVTLPDGKHRCEVTVVVASVGAGDRVFNHKVSEMEAVVDDKRFEQQWNKPATFDLVVDLPPKTRYVRIVVRDAKSDHIGSADLAHDALPFR